MINIRLRIYGIVQGVNFRYSTKLKADELGVTGFVFNEKDGSVFIEAQGTEDQIGRLKNWCQSGPRMARVDKIEEETGEVKNHNGFQLIR